MIDFDKEKISGMKIEDVIEIINKMFQEKDKQIEELKDRLAKLENPEKKYI